MASIVSSSGIPIIGPQGVGLTGVIILAPTSPSPFQGTLYIPVSEGLLADPVNLEAGNYYFTYHQQISVDLAEALPTERNYLVSVEGGVNDLSELPDRITSASAYRVSKVSLESTLAAVRAELAILEGAAGAGAAESIALLTQERDDLTAQVATLVVDNQELVALQTELTQENADLTAQLSSLIAEVNQYVALFGALEDMGNDTSEDILKHLSGKRQVETLPNCPTPPSVAVPTAKDGISQARVVPAVPLACIKDIPEAVSGTTIRAVPAEKLSALRLTPRQPPTVLLSELTPEPAPVAPTLEQVVLDCPKNLE